MFFKQYDKQHNTIHVISLSCNPVPPLRYGGIELVVAHLCEGLVELDADVKCYSPGPLDLPGVTHCQTLEEPSLHIKQGGLPNTQAHLLNIKRLLRKNLRRGDVVLFNHADHYRYLRKRLGIWFWLTANFYEIAHWVDAGIQKNVIYPSAHLKREVGKPGYVIPHGEKLLFNTLPTAPRQDYLFFAGRITQDKGVDLALQACKILGVKLLLAGPLNDKAFATPILADASVEYLGELTYTELFAYYCQCKALVYMTQYTEPFGLSVIEAMAAGAPVITTGKGGTGETVIADQTGYFASSVADIVAAYHKLHLLNSVDCVARAQDYTLEVMAQRYLALFEGHAHSS